MSVVLVAHKQVEQEDDVKEVTAKTTPSMNACEGRPEASKGKSKMVEDDDSSTLNSR